MDIYPLAISFYAILFIATLFSLKSTLKAIEYRQRNQIKQSKIKVSNKNHQDNHSKKQKWETCRIYKYLIKNFTIASLFGGRMQTSMLLILFTYSIVSLYLYFTAFWQISLGFGAIISLTALAIQMIQQRYMNSKDSDQDQVTTNEKRWGMKKIVYVLITITAIALYLTMVGLCYRNYINSRLKSMMINFLIVFTIDNFALKPFLFIPIALIAHGNRQLILIVDKQERSKQVNLVKVANDFDRPQTKHHFVVNLQVQPQPIDMTKSKEFTGRKKELSKSNRSKQLSKSNRSKQFNQSRIFYNNALQALPSSSVIDNQGNNEGSLAHMICPSQMNKSGMHKMTSMKELNEIQLQKIEQNPGAQLQHYFCINLRRSRETQQSKHMQNKLESILQKKPNIQTSQFVKEFILQDFVCCSPKKQEVNQALKEQQEIKSKLSKSKGSLKGAKTFRMIQREQRNINLDDKENTVGQSTKNEISEGEVQGTPKGRFPSRGRRSDNRTHHILKISERQTGQLEQIDVNSPNKRVHKPQYNTHVIPEQAVKIKQRRNRRRTTKQISHPYILQDKLMQVYFPGKNKSDLQNYIRSKKKNFDRSQFFNNSNKKEHSKGREKPIVHESEQHHTQFFIPKF